MSICPKCGAEIRDGAAFCSECGQRLALPSPPPKKKSKNGTAIAVAAVILAVIALVLFGSNKHEEASPVDSSGVVVTEAEVTEPQMTEEEYKAECAGVNYKDLCRYPDDYAGTKVRLTVKVSQVMDASFFSSDKAWRCYTDNSGNGFYFDDEYYILDKRGDGAVKILEDDIITVYGEFTGLEKVTRALTGTDEEVPRIEARYVELVEEEPVK